MGAHGLRERLLRYYEDLQEHEARLKVHEANAIVLLRVIAALLVEDSTTKARIEELEAQNRHLLAALALMTHVPCMTR